MWRDSFAVNRLVTTSLGGAVHLSRQLPAESIEDDYLLEVERRANHMRRRDTHSFEPFNDEGETKKVPFKVPNKQQSSRQLSVNVEEKEPDSSDDEEDELVSPPQPEVGVDDLFSSTGERRGVRTVFHNPLAPQTPPQLTRKHGSLVNFLKAFETSKGAKPEEDPLVEAAKSEAVNPRFSDYQTKLRSYSSGEENKGETTSTSELSSVDASITTTPPSRSGSTTTTMTTPTRPKSGRVMVERVIKKSLSFVKSRKPASPIA